MADAHGIRIKTGIVVCKPYVARRALAAAQKQWREVGWFARPPLISIWDCPNDIVPAVQMIELMVGNVSRLIAYAKAGFQADVEVPLAVRRAYEDLIKVGFDRYLVCSRHAAG